MGQDFHRQSAKQRKKGIGFKENEKFLHPLNLNFMALLIRICRKSHNSLKPETKQSVASLLMLRYSFSCFSNFVAPTGIEPVFHA